MSRPHQRPHPYAGVGAGIAGLAQTQGVLASGAGVLVRRGVAKVWAITNDWTGPELTRYELRESLWTKNWRMHFYANSYVDASFTYTPKERVSETDAHTLAAAYMNLLNARRTE